MNTGQHSLNWRAIIALLSVAILGSLAVTLYQAGPSMGGWWPGCIFYRITGLHCIGCGMTRATHALLHLRIGSAFAYNPLGVALLPFVTVGVGLEILAWIRGPQRHTPRWRPSRRSIIALVTIMLTYWILRNLPWWPFTLLAPA